MFFRSPFHPFQSRKLLAASVVLASALTTAACSDEKSSAPPCPPGQANCACAEADKCDEGLTCEMSVCRGAEVRSITVSDERARSCELLVTEKDGGHMLRATFADTVRGTFVPERPLVAVTFAATSDAPIGSDAVALLQSEGAGTLELTKSKCFDAKGAVLANAEVTLEDAR